MGPKENRYEPMLSYSACPQLGNRNHESVSTPNQPKYQFLGPIYNSLALFEAPNHAI
jgi:hypothetical protein